MTYQNGIIRAVAGQCSSPESCFASKNFNQKVFLSLPQGQLWMGMVHLKSWDQYLTSGQVWTTSIQRFRRYSLLSNLTKNLTLLCLASHKWDNGKQSRPRSDAAECGVWSGSILFALNTGISIKYGNNKN